MPDPVRHPPPFHRRRLSAAQRHEIWKGIRIQLLVEIRRTARMIDGALEELGEHTRMPERERRALEYIDRSRGAPCISDVGRAFRLSRQAAHRVVMRLHRQGRVRLFTHANRRIVQIRLTPLGSSSIRIAGGRTLSLLWSMTHGMPDETLENATAFLRTLQNQIRNPRYGDD